MKPYTASDNEMSHALVKRIRWAAHLRLMTGVDYEQIAKEAEAAIAEQEIEPAEFKFGMRGSPLRVAGVIDVEKDPLHGAKMLLAKDNGERAYEPTDLGTQMPTAVKLINQITSFPGRVKISFMPAHSHVPYHPHLDYTYVVHIPLKTNEKVKMAVKFPDGREFLHHYEKGSVYLFNSQHLHAVINDSDEPRIHLWCNFGQMLKGEPNTKLNDLITAALKLRNMPV